MLLDNAGDDSHGDAVLFIQMCYGKAHVVFSRGPAPVITGMRNGVGSVGKTDIHDAFMDMGNCSGIFTLNTASEDYRSFRRQIRS